MKISQPSQAIDRPTNF